MTASGIRFRTEGLDGFSEDLIGETIPAMIRGVEEAEILFVNQIKRELTGKRTGRTYRVPGTKRAVHVASAPGEAPAVLFGHLRNSIGYEKPVHRGDRVTGEVGTGLGIGEAQGDIANAYARRLELGGTDSRGITILPRPYIRPAQDKVEPSIVRLWRRLFR